MEDKIENTKRCSSKEHENIEALFYCFQCNVYMCNKCNNFHNNLCKFHDVLNINKYIKEDIFTGYCKEKGHNLKLEYFCENHNQLVCDACIIKINVRGKGKHKDCNICLVEDIKESKKNKFRENINKMPNLLNDIDNNLKQLKININKINKFKEEFKLKIQKIFTKIRTAINEREDQLLNEADKLIDDLSFNEELINEAEKLPNKIKTSYEKAKIIDKEWDKCQSNSIVNDCINIENIIKKSFEINNAIKKFKDSQYNKIEFLPNEDKEIQNILKPIFAFCIIKKGIHSSPPPPPPPPPPVKIFKKNGFANLFG